MISQQSKNENSGHVISPQREAKTAIKINTTPLERNTLSTQFSRRHCTSHQRSNWHWPIVYEHLNMGHHRGTSEYGTPQRDIWIWDTTGGHLNMGHHRGTSEYGTPQGISKLSFYSEASLIQRNYYIRTPSVLIERCPLFSLNSITLVREMKLVCNINVWVWWYIHGTTIWCNFMYLSSIVYCIEITPVGHHGDLLHKLMCRIKFSA